MSVEGYQTYSGQFVGLSESEVEMRRKEYGMNALPARERPSRIAIFLIAVRKPPCLRNLRGSCDISVVKRIQGFLYNHGCCAL